MAIGDGIRRNVAKLSTTERDRLRDAFVELGTRLYPDGVSYWFKQDQIHQATHVHAFDPLRGIAFLPWHREVCRRLEQLLRDVDPQLSLHYWDWTTDPRASDNGHGGTTNLLTPAFFGSSSGRVGTPFDTFDNNNNFGGSRDESGIPARPPMVITRDVSAGSPNQPPDETIITTGDGASEQDQYNQMRAALENAHDDAHLYIGGDEGTLSNAHVSFQDPFVFLLHSNVDRLFATWQAKKPWRRDPERVYGVEGNSDTAPPPGLYDPGILTPVEPWAGNADNDPRVTRIRPWGPPDNQQVVRNYKHPLIASPPRYDTTRVPRAPDEAGGPAVTAHGPHPLDVFIRGRHNHELVHRYWDGEQWSGWINLGGDLAAGPAVTSGGPHLLDVFVRGKHNDELVHRFLSPSGWSGWINLGGDLASAPAVTSGGPHRLDVFVRGKHNHELVHRFLDANGWSGWNNLGGDLAAGPAVTSGGPHWLDVFVRGKHNDELVHRFLDANGWSGWNNLGGDLAAAPTVTSHGPHVLDVFVRGKHNHELVHRFLDANGWSGWNNLGGDLAAAPTVTSHGPHVLDVFVRGKHNDELVHRFLDSSGWSGWNNLGGDLA